MKNKNCLVYIAGILTSIIFIPIINDVTDIVCNKLEFIKGMQNLKITEINNKIMDAQNQDNDGQSETRAIGFDIPNEDDYEEESDE